MLANSRVASLTRGAGAQRVAAEARGSDTRWPAPSRSRHRRRRAWHAGVGRACRRCASECLLCLPHRLQQLGPRLHTVAALDQALEQLELGGGQLDVLAVHDDPVRVAIHGDRPAHEAAAGRHRRRGEAPQDRADAKDQLLGRERLREIVVRAEGQALDAVGFFFPRREQQDAHVASFIVSPQLREHLESRVTRQHEIQHHEIGALFARRAQCIGAGAGGGDAVAFFGEMIRDQRRNVGLVVHDENTVDRAGLGRHAARKVA